MSKRPVSQRFWEKVIKSGDCWLWQGAKTPNGYGRFWDGSRHIYAHRFSYELAGGAIPEKYHCCHHCDTPSCVNPKHIFVGTPKDNMVDRDKKGRMDIRHLQVPRKLSVQSVIAIRSAYRSGGVSQSTLANKYQVNQSVISRIVNCKDWKHVIESQRDIDLSAG